MFKLDAVVVVVPVTTGGDNFLMTCCCCCCCCLEFEFETETSRSLRNEAASFRIKGLLDDSNLELAVATDSESSELAALTLDVVGLFILC